MTTFIAFVVVFGTIVFFHELGHFLMAKLAGIRVYEFALGFGPAAIKRTLGETQYSIRVFPLGGFVKLAGMDEDPESTEVLSADDPRSFRNKSLGWRMGTIAAGPAMNFILAAVMFAFYFMLIIVPPTISMIEQGSPAHQGGLQPGDVFVEIQGQNVNTIDEVIGHIDAHAGSELAITVQRGSERVSLTATPAEVDGRGRLGMDIFEKPQLPIGQSLIAAVVQTGYMTRQLVLSIWEMITGAIEPDIAGPIGIVQIVGETANQGISQLLLLAAILNINLGLLNLLPIPVLDGGWLVILAIEGVRGKPVDPRYRGIAGAIGLALLLMLMVFATFQDILRLNWFS